MGELLSSTFSAPFRVAFADLWTTFLVPFLILWPVFLAALPVEWAASLVSCLIPSSVCCAMAPRERARPTTIANKNFSRINAPRSIGFTRRTLSCLPLPLAPAPSPELLAAVPVESGSWTATASNVISFVAQEQATSRRLSASFGSYFSDASLAWASRNASLTSSRNRLEFSLCGPWPISVSWEVTGLP